MKKKHSSVSTYDYINGMIVHELANDTVVFRNNQYVHIPNYASRKLNQDIVNTFIDIMFNFKTDDKGNYMTNDSYVGGLNSWVCGRSDYFDSTIYKSRQINKIKLTQNLKDELLKRTKNGLKLNLV